MAKNTYYGAFAVIGVVSFIIVDTAARDNRSSFNTYGSERGINLNWKPDTTAKDAVRKDTLKYPISDRRGTSVTDPVRNAIDLKDPSNISREVEYDPITKQYTVKEKIGSQFYRQPTYLSFQEYSALQAKQSEEDYWKKRAGTLGSLNQRTSGPQLNTGGKLFDRVFGGTKVEIKPQGSLGLTFGYEGQNIKNPVLVERARKNGGFAFDMDINMNVTGKIGDKLKILTNYNTQSTFDYENQIKLEYTGYDDEIIKKIEAGNVSFPLRSQLISGIQSLFGVKTQLQFGKLMVTSVLSNQKSQKQTMTLKGGTQTTDFAIRTDEYEDNRHFLMAQFFRDTFNYAMANLPVIRSLTNINRMEVWVTNKTGSTTNTRDIVGLMDLGEYDPFNPGINVLTASRLPDRGTNDLYSRLISDGGARNTSTVVSRLLALGLTPVQEFEKTFARKLDSTEYTYNRQLGFLSLNIQLNPDDVLAVAYQYSYNGRTYQVGEFSQDVPPDQNAAANQQILFLKLLKATSARPALPIWDLMMKNVYGTGAYQVNRADFKMDVYYKDPGTEDRAPSEKRYLPDGQGTYRGAPIITILNLDRLNNQNDPQPDGQFDFVEGYTIRSENGRIMFPMLEPFAQGIQKALGGDPALESQYVYSQLYDSIKVAAQQFQALNRYVLRGSYKSSNSSEIQLGGINIPSNSVIVTAGGQVLRENVDYIISLGTLKIINQGVLASGVPINVSFENNTMFGQQVRNYMGTRLDYTVNDKLTIGSTIVRMSERPYYQKVNYGDDPIKNTVVGLDAAYASEWKGLTRLLDKLPNYQTTTMSNINFQGEVARLFPGHNKLINAAGSKEGQSYIDDFEGARNGYDLKFPATSWALASTPRDATDAGGAILFPEAGFNDSLEYNRNRAKLAWYIIEPTLQIPGSPNLPSGISADDQSDPRVRLVYQKDVFPNRSTDFGQSQLSTLDLAYYPQDKGPYNFERTPGRITADGKLTNPRQRWGGIMRAIDNSDFETANIEFIEFWIQDPFILNPTSTGGELYFNLGNVSEDILKDSRKFFENGMPNPTDRNKLDSSVWGRIPVYQQQITQAFDNDPAIRQYQDVGYDGLRSEDERTFRQAYLNELAANFGTGSAVYQQALADPSTDDYHYYRGNDYDAARLSILERYKRVNNPEGNSPVSDNNSQFSSAATNYPESEDLNRDNTMNETEEYFQYRVNLTPNMQVGSNFVVDKFTTPVTLPNKTTVNETWYQFKIPITQYSAKVGSIPDFKSIRFMRMFMTGFQDSVVMRFAKLELVRNQWRRYLYELAPGNPVPINENTNFVVSAVNIEENGKRTPIPYVVPPGILRQNTLSTNNTNLLMNEQALSLQVCNLPDGESRALYRTQTADLRQYNRLQMFVHAEAVGDQASLKDGDVAAILRLGSDFTENYYEYQIPLAVTPWSSRTDLTIWPEANNIDLLLSTLSALKQKRNIEGASPLLPYSATDAQGRTITVVGNPNLGDVRNMMIGVVNPANDGLQKCTEIWFNEMRLTGLDEKGGYAAVGRVDLQLADLGTFTASGAMHTAGFGGVDQRVNDRFRDNFTQFDVAANLDLGKLAPKRWGLSIPVYAGYSQTVSTPEYDPYDLDIKLKDKLRLARNREEKDSIRRDAQDFTSIKSINFTNVRKLNMGSSGKSRLWDIENFDVSYSFSQINRHTPLIEHDNLTKHRGGLGYNFAGQEHYLEPFKNLIRSKSPWLALIKDVNFNYVPSMISFRADISRQFGATRMRNIGGGEFKLQETYDKYFTFDRYYGLKWNFTRNLTVDFNAVNNARIDEPYGRINDKAKKDTVRDNFFKLGRTTNYYHSATATYALPLNKIPALDWTTATVSYGTDYRWIGASILAKYLGNAIENTQMRTGTLDLKFSSLYNKSKFLRKVTTPTMQVSQNRPQPGATNPNATAQPKKEETDEVPLALRILLRPLLSLKTMNFKYTESSGTRLPGYIDSTKVMGMNWASMSPGLNFVFGYQPDKAWLDKFSQKGLITPDTTFNVQMQQQFTQRFDVTAVLEPANDLRIELTMVKSFSKTFTALYKDSTGAGDFGSLNPYSSGGFEISFIAIKTMFGKIDTESGVSSTFRNFENFRKVVSERLGNNNPYNANTPVYDPKDPEYRYGYGRYSQDVIIPAFLAAYTKTSPGKAPLIENYSANTRSNPFKKILPRPNWHIDYTGLSRLDWFRDIFSQFTLRHDYKGRLSMNSYNTAPYFYDPLVVAYPSFRDTVSGNYVPYFLVPNLTIQEDFSPLLEVDMTFINSLNLTFGYKKTRTLSLSLIDYQLTEMRSSEIAVGGGYRVRGFPMPFKIGKNGGRKLENDLNFKLDLSFRDDRTANNRLDADLIIPTSGQKVIGISPTIDYTVNNRINLKFFYDRRQSIPVISTSYPTTTTRGGVTFRFMLAQ
ncbi:cell surface protein SprA [uncultured Chitinophaga sp.]|uniref:T9SS outer membrane translocon Sov/SprA n=1 Tax=uncultured Chitinophaga sp. TaxID=339340 RepID=UPI0025D316DB|nr:cell surface protein SprA [uncultured Chitinophaga sp.]